MVLQSFHHFQQCKIAFIAVHRMLKLIMRRCKAFPQGVDDDVIEALSSVVQSYLDMTGGTVQARVPQDNHLSADIISHFHCVSSTYDEEHSKQ